MGEQITCPGCDGNKTHTYSGWAKTGNPYSYNGQPRWDEEHITTTRNCIICDGKETVSKDRNKHPWPCDR
jgi:hypothetical protein